MLFLPKCATKYYEGSHLIEAIRDRDYLQNVLSRLNKCVEIMTDIIESEGPSTPFKHFKADEIHKIIGKNGVEYLIAQIGLYAYEVLQQKLIVDEAEFELPVEVKQQLSAGEKQIFIMALYQALSQLNKINVPYIVDTPFARIDKEHRGKILSQFFKKLNGQIIILSTDEEIVGEYRESISDIISNTFVLNHTANGNTEILANTYFGGKHND